MPRPLGFGLGLFPGRGGGSGLILPSITAFSVGPESGLDLPASITLIEGATAPTAIYIVGVVAGSGTPSATQIIAGQNSAGAAAAIATSIASAATGSQSLTFTPPAGGTYDFYAVAVDAGAVRSAVASSLGVVYSGAITGPILDSISALGAFSLRLLKTGAPSPIRVRRSSDNALAVIPWKLYPARNNTFWVDEDALLAHCGAGSGFVETQYDQSGNGFDISIATAAFQPRIVNAGVIETVNSLPALRFRHAGTVNTLRRAAGLMYNNAGGSTVFSVAQAQATQSVLATVVGELNGGNIYRAIQRSTTATANAQFFVGIAGTQVNGGLIATNGFNGSPQIVATRDTQTNYKGYLNGVENSNVNYTRSGTAFTPNQFDIGLEYNGHISETIIFPPLTNFEMNAVFSSQGDAYGITVSSL